MPILFLLSPLGLLLYLQGNPDFSQPGYTGPLNLTVIVPLLFSSHPILSHLIPFVNTPTLCLCTAFRAPIIPPYYAYSINPSTLLTTTLLGGYIGHVKVSRPETWHSRIVGHGEEPPDQLLANPLQWKIHPKAQQDALSGILSKVGWVQSVVVNRRTQHMIDGHARVGLAISRGEPTVPVVYVDLSEEEERLMLAALDPLSAMAVADKDQLAALLAEVRVGDAAVQAMLAELAEKSGLGWGKPVAEDPGAQMDRAAELQEKWGTALGQIWEISSKSVQGKAHRLMCGDSTKAEDVARLMGGAEPFLTVTDPPWGVEYDPMWRAEAAKKGFLDHSSRRVGKVTNDDCTDWSAAWALVPGDVIYSWHPAGAESLVHGKALQDSGFILRMQIIWAKSNFPIGRGDYHVRHEPCWYAVREGKASRRTDDRTQNTLWEINLDRNVEGRHSTQKPVECMARPIRNHDTMEVYDPFLGSGTTMVAAEQLGRLCYGMEIHPPYIAVTLERLQVLGLTPQLVLGLADG